MAGSELGLCSKVVLGSSKSSILGHFVCALECALIIVFRKEIDRGENGRVKLSSWQEGRVECGCL